MKKILLLAGIALLSLNVSAQEKSGLQGVWWAGGQVAFGSTKTGDVKTTSNTILPIVGTFITPSVTVGAGIGVMNGKSENGTVTTAENSTFIVKPLVRKYWNITGGLYFYGQASLPMMFGNDKQNKVKSTSVTLDVAPGFDYIVNKWLTVETSFSLISLGSTTTKPDAGEKTTSFGFNAQAMNTVSDRQLGDLMVGVKFLF